MTLSFFPRVGVAALLLGGACALPAPALGNVVFTVTQLPGGVQVNGSGTLNLTGLTFVTAGGNNSASIYPAQAALLSGLFGGVGSTSIYSSITGPSNFGGGPIFPATVASSGAGSAMGINGQGGALIVPAGYVSGTPLTTSSTYNGATFASLGFVPGTYTYTWGSGANADSLTITSVIPEPSTWALALGGAGILGLVARRRRRARG